MNLRSFFGSMTAKIFIILVGGTLITGGLITALASYEREDLQEHIRMRHMAERVEQIISILEALPAPSRQAMANVAEKYGIKIDMSNSVGLIGKFPDTEFSTLLKQTLNPHREFTVFEGKNEECPARKKEAQASSSSARHCQIVFTHLQDGTPLKLDITYRDRPPLPFPGKFIRDVALFLTALVLIALFVAHMATKPLRRLAQAAHDLGRNIEHQPLAEDKGSTEVKEASAAFNAMQASIRNHIQARTYMLAAIAHDLQTPLTRLRLRLEKVEDANLREQLVADLTATQAMVREGLEFARSINSEEPIELVDLDSLIEAICNDATDAGCEVVLSGTVGKPVLAFPNALRRCISNLLDNAIHYGKFAHIIVKREHAKAVISIVDGGPGIPEDELETVFQPFKRLENSRSRTSGGTGLGLTIARIIAEKHRGSIRLRNMDTMELGLVAILELPAP